MPEKWYVVWKGRKPGIYPSWEECAKQVLGFPRAKFKAFPTQEAARLAYEGDAEDYVGGSQREDRVKVSPDLARLGVVIPSISVDASARGNPGPLEYRGVDNATGEVLFHIGGLYGSNNVGEFLALVHALAEAKRKGMHNLTVYTDSEVALSWLERGGPEAVTCDDKTLGLVDRAVRWLEENEWANPVLLWNKERWGEIPADFGRKRR